MKNAIAMSVLHCFSNLVNESNGVVFVEWIAGKEFCERITFHEFHGVERLALVLATVKNRHDARVLHYRGETSFF